ncbi:MAG: hypothetical protein RL394_1223, partial [Bacteroidota bacterium]
LITRNLIIVTAFITELKSYFKKDTFTHSAKYSI